MTLTSLSPTQWICGPDTGPSSITIYCEMTGEKAKHPEIPLEEEEFAKCHRLLEMHTTQDTEGLGVALHKLGEEAREHMNDVARYLVSQGHIAEQSFDSELPTPGIAQLSA